MTELEALRLRLRKLSAKWSSVYAVGMAPQGIHEASNAEIFSIYKRTRARFSMRGCPNPWFVVETGTVRELNTFVSGMMHMAMSEKART